MRLLILANCISLFLSGCTNKQVQNSTSNEENIELGATGNKVDSGNIMLSENGTTFPKDTFILGIPYSRIDSLKTAGRKQGATSSNDSVVAMFLLLSDSVRIIGNHQLDYDGQRFTKRVYNKKASSRLDAEIIEEKEGIVSIQKRMHDKPEYFPLLDMQIEFYDRKNKLINSFNINKSNPFLKDKSKKVLEYQYPPPDDRSDKNSTPGFNWKKHVKKYYAYNRFNVQENGYVIVDYNLYAMDQNERILQSISTLVILDSTGKEYTRFNEIENMVHHYFMTADGKHLLINGGGILGEGFQRLEKSFIKIYETNSKKIIYHEILENLEDDFGDFYESEVPPKIMTQFTRYKISYNNYFTTLIFDLNSRIRCIKTFSRLDNDRITNEGIKYSANVWLQKFKFDCKTF
jgi:hypothetical protein